MQSNAEFSVLAKSQDEPTNMLIFGPKRLKMANISVGLKNQLPKGSVARTFDPGFGTCLKWQTQLGVLRLT